MFASRRSLVCLVLVAGTLTVAAVPAAADDPSPVSQVADAQSAPDDATAQLIAKRYGHAVTVDADMSETEQVQARPDGTMVLSQSTEPVRVQRDDGWVPVDTALASSAGVLQPAAAAVPVQFSAGGSSTVLARIQAPSGEWLTESWQGGALPTAVVAGDSATYPEVYPGVDLQMSATPTGMSEVLVIKNAEAATNPALSHVGFGVSDGSMTTTTDGSGTTVTTASGSDKLVSSSAKWWDSSSPGASPSGPGGLGVPLPAATAVTETQLTVNAAAAAQTDGVTYPVYVDPSWTGTTTGWAFVDQTYPNTAYWKDSGASDPGQHVGYVDAGHSDDGRSHLTRSFWQMDTSRVNHTHIVSASFQVTNVYSYSCSARQVDLYTAGAVSSSSTWNTQPGLSALVDSKSFAWGYSSACAAQTNNVSFDAAGAVQRAADAASDTINLALKAHDETDPFGWKKFSGPGQLVIGYQSYPATPSYRALTPCWAACGLGAYTNTSLPNFQAWSNIADSGVNLNLAFQVCQGTPSSTGGCKTTFHSFGVPPNTKVVHGMPTDEPLTEGGRVYRAMACRSDTTTICSDWSAWFNFTVDLHRPNAPHVTSAQLGFDTGGVAGTAVEGQPATFTIDANGSTDDLVYSWSTTTGAYALSSASCPRDGAGGVHIVCAKGTVTASVVPMKMTGDVSVYAFDKAGNRSDPFDGTYDLTITEAVDADHAWYGSLANFSEPAQPTEIADAATGTVPLQLTNVSWLRGPDPDDPGNDPPGDPTIDPSIPSGHATAWKFSGVNSQAVATGSAANPAATLDGTHSMTAVAWVKPDADSSGTRVIMSQDTTGGTSLFTLQENDTNRWQMCVQLGTQMCATSSSVASSDGSWTLVVGQWSSATAAGTRSLRVASYRYDATGARVLSGGIDAPPEVSPGTAPTASSGPLVLGRDQSAGQHRWKGEMTDPIVFNSYLDSNQIGAIWGARPEFSEAN